MEVKILKKYDIGEYLVRYGGYIIPIASETLEFCSCCKKRIMPQPETGKFFEVPEDIAKLIRNHL